MRHPLSFSVSDPRPDQIFHQAPRRLHPKEEPEDDESGHLQDPQRVHY